MNRPLTILAVVSCALVPHMGCGGGGGSGSGVSTVSGNVSNAATASDARPERSWTAWLREDVLGIGRRAWAQMGDTSLDGIQVTAASGGRSKSDDTGGNGRFSIGGAPTGDLRVTFQRGSCDANLELPDVADGSTLDLQDVAFACVSVHPGKVAESLRGVIRNKPASPNGNLTVCIASGGANRNRVVKLKDASFSNTSFADLQPGDQIDVNGAREGNGANSALDATTISFVRHDVDDCGESPTPTATPTAPAT